MGMLLEKHSHFLLLTFGFPLFLILLAHPLDPRLPLPIGGNALGRCIPAAPSTIMPIPSAKGAGSPRHSHIRRQIQ